MALDGIVMSERRANGKRFVSSYCGVMRAESDGVRLEEYVGFDAVHESWTLVREPPFVERGVELGVFDEGEVESWRQSLRG